MLLRDREGRDAAGSRRAPGQPTDRVGLFADLEELLTAHRRLQVELEALLPCAQVGMESAGLGLGGGLQERRKMTRRVARRGRLDVDDLSSEGGEELAAVARGDRAASIHDHDVGQGFGFHGGTLC